MRNKIAKILMHKFSDAIVVFGNCKYEEKCIVIADEIENIYNSNKTLKQSGLNNFLFGFSIGIILVLLCFSAFTIMFL